VSARQIAAQRNQEKTAAEKALADARLVLQTVTGAVAAGKKELEAANAARAGAEKALADKRAPLDSALAKVQGLKSEIEALAVDKKRADTTTKGGLASAARPGS
jgi:hypothetical protein